MPHLLGKRRGGRENDLDSTTLSNYTGKKKKNKRRGEDKLEEKRSEKE